MKNESKKTVSLLFVGIVSLMITAGCKPATQQTVEGDSKTAGGFDDMLGGFASVTSTIVNTSFNTWFRDDKWQSTMGPLTDSHGGIACDHKAAKMGDKDKFRRGDYAVWFVAPSDSLAQFGIKRCGPNPHGGEPSCEENWNLCGRKVRITCAEGDQWCAKAGESSLAAQYKAGDKPTNDYIPSFYADAVTQKVGAKARAPKSIVLYITDFCPANHSENKKSGNCQIPQLDISTSAFMLMGKKNPQGYINSAVKFNAKLLPSNDRSPAGPQY